MPADVALRLTDRLLEPPLTAREVEVLHLIAEGMRNKEIAQQLKITAYTTQDHVKSILAKLGVNDRAGAVAVGLKRGIIHLEGA